MGKPSGPAKDGSKDGQIHVRVPIDTTRLVDELQEHYVRKIGFKPSVGDVVMMGIKALAEKEGIRTS